MSKNLTYRELLRKLIAIPTDRLDDNVSVHVRDSDEFYAVTCTKTATDNNEAGGILDKGHLFLKTV